LKLRYGAAALRQIADTLSYIQERSPQGAASLQKRILEAAALLGDHPYAAEATSRPDTRRAVLTPYPYVIFYRIMSDEIFIIRFRHTSRKPIQRPA